MADIKAIKELALHAARKTVPTEFANSNKTVTDVNDALRAELFELCGTYKKFRQNKNTLFEIMEETMDEVVPQAVSEAIMAFADVRTYPNGTKPEFKLKKGKERAKKFATRATASGVYETFRLDSDVVPFDYFAIGDAAYIDFERFLSGDEDWADYLEALMTGIVDYIYKSVYKAMVTAGRALQEAGSHAEVTNYSAKTLVEILNKVRPYGAPVIVANSLFIDNMGPDVMGNETTHAVLEQDMNDIHNFGRVLKFRGVPVVELPVNTQELEADLAKPYAFILPASDEKIVKVAFEGDTVVREWDNRDNSMEIQAYKKLGIAMITGAHWGFLEITASV